MRGRLVAVPHPVVADAVIVPPKSILGVVPFKLACLRLSAVAKPISVAAHAGLVSPLHMFEPVALEPAIPWDAGISFLLESIPASAVIDIPNARASVFVYTAVFWVEKVAGQNFALLVVSPGVHDVAGDAHWLPTFTLALAINHLVTIIALAIVDIVNAGVRLLYAAVFWAVKFTAFLRWPLLHLARAGGLRFDQRFNIVIRISLQVTAGRIRSAEKQYKYKNWYAHWNHRRFLDFHDLE